MLFLLFLIHNFVQPAFHNKSICLHKGNFFHGANVNKWNTKVNYNSPIISDNYSKIKHRVPIDLESLPGFFRSSTSVITFVQALKESIASSPFELQQFSHRKFSTKSQADLMVKCCFLKITSGGGALRSGLNYLSNLVEIKYSSKNQWVVILLNWMKYPEK